MFPNQASLAGYSRKVTVVQLIGVLSIIVNGIRLPLVTASLISLVESSKKGPLCSFSFSSLPAAEAQFCF